MSSKYPTFVDIMKDLDKGKKIKLFYCDFSRNLKEMVLDKNNTEYSYRYIRIRDIEYNFRIIDNGQNFIYYSGEYTNDWYDSMEELIVAELKKEEYTHSTIKRRLEQSKVRIDFLKEKARPLFAIS